MTSPIVFKSPSGRQAVFDFYDRVLAAWQIPYETHTISTRYGDTFMITSGDSANPPLILLHGGSSNSATWAGDVSTYAAHYHVHAVDLPGEPGKSAPVHLPYDGRAYAEWLDDVRSALGADSVTLVGLSLGGWTAVKYATLYPQHVTALALLTPGGITPHDERFFLKILPLFLLGKWGQRRAMQMLFADVPVPDGTIEGMGIIMRHFKPRREPLPLFTDDELASLSMPALMIGGEKDRLLNVEATAARLKRLVPQVETHIIPGAGHAIIQTAPEVLRFLTRQHA